jgi:cell division transport system ATP-binding protein
VLGSESMIKLKNVIKEFKNGIQALKGVDLEIQSGEFVYIIGPSGAGKSTLLKLLYREEICTSGEIYYGDLNLSNLKRRHVYKLRRRVAVVYQDYKLLEDQTVYENVAFVLEMYGLSKEEIRKRVLMVLDSVGVKGKAKYFPNQLSGGEQQRVAIARALVNKPSIVICDEPTGNLDPVMSREIYQILGKINKMGATVIVATHDKDLVNTYRHRVISLEHGKIIRDQEDGEYHYANENS